LFIKNNYERFVSKRSEKLLDYEKLENKEKEIFLFDIYAVLHSFELIIIE